MGGAIAEGALTAGTVQPGDLTICDPRKDLVDRFAAKGWEVNYNEDNAKGIKNADLIVVAVKPWLVEQVLEQLSPVIDRQAQAVVSIAAGVPFAKLGEYIDADCYGGPALYRVIPNTAIAIRKSVTFIASYNSNSTHDSLVHTLFGPLGEIYEVGESQMEAVTALSSSGIAYAYKYIQASALGGVTLGLPEEMALKIVLGTVEGAVEMLRHNGSEPQEEINKVTTPGGITLKGLEAMEKNGFTRAVTAGLEATK